MRKRFLRYIMLIAIVFGLNSAYSQCTPGNEETCPDPEGNGQMCPEILNPVYIGKDYQQEVTILSPLQLDTLNLQIPVHHLTLIDVENLPEGISWVSNAENNEFMAGLYYCMLLSGTTNVDAANYPLKIIVDVFADVQGVPVKVATLADSTTLSLDVKWDPNSVNELAANQLIARMWPNPVTNVLNLELKAELQGKVDLELFNLMGHKLMTKSFESSTSNPFISLDLSGFPSGTYMLNIKNNNHRHSRLIAVSNR